MQVQHITLCSKDASLEIEHLRAKGLKKPPGSCSSFGAAVGKQSPASSAILFHKEFEENSLLGCYHHTSLGKKC